MGSGGIGGSFMFGAFLFKFPNKGFGGGIKFDVIPPLASGIYEGSEGCFETLSPTGGGGLFIINDGILLALFGLF